MLINDVKEDKIGETKNVPSYEKLKNFGKCLNSIFGYQLIMATGRL